MRVSALATLVAGAIDALHSETVRRLIGLADRPFDPSPVSIWPEDIPKGFVVGALYISDEEEIEERAAEGTFGSDGGSDTGEVIEDTLWVAHVGMPPFVLKLSDLNIEDVDNEDIWATVRSEHVLSHLQWLSSMSCDRDQLRALADHAAEILRDIADETLPSYS